MLLILLKNNIWIKSIKSELCGFEYHLNSVTRVRAFFFHFVTACVMCCVPRQCSNRIVK